MFVGKILIQYLVPPDPAKKYQLWANMENVYTDPAKYTGEVKIKGGRKNPPASI